MAHNRWRVTDSSYAVETAFLRLRKDTIALPDGRVIEDYFVRESRGFVVICAVTPRNEIVLVRQYKHGIGKEILELPAGAIDPDESPHDCAVRELREETGYSAPQMQFVRSFVVEPTNSNSIAHLFLALDANKTSAQDLDITEEIAVEVVPSSRVREWVRDGTIECMPHVAALYLLYDLGLLS